MSTDFLDVLEGQLEAAARRRYERPHRRRLPGALLVAAASAAVVALVIAVAGGGSGTLHGARTPAAGSGPAIPSVRGIEVAVLNGAQNPARALALAGRLRAAGARVTRVGDAPQLNPNGSTFVDYRHGHESAALAISQFINHLPPGLAALRVFGEGSDKADVAVHVGRDDIVAPPPTAAVRFEDGCPGHVRELHSGDIENAMASVLLAAPPADRAVVITAYINGHVPEASGCGPTVAARTVVVVVDRTARGTSEKLSLACDGHGWRVWHREPY